MMTETEQVTTKQIAYWPDGYLVDEDAAKQAEILDSIEAFGAVGHTLLDVPVIADRKQMQLLVNAELE